MSLNSQSNRSTCPPVAMSEHHAGRDQRGREERFGSDGQTVERIVERARHDGDAGWNDTPNPFSRMLAASEPTATARFIRAAKTLVIMLALTALLLAGVFYGKQFLLAQLVAGFDELDAASQQSSLTKIASFGSDAIEPLIGKLATADDAVSEFAFTLLRQLQNDWVTLSPDAAKTAHERMIRAIATTFVAPHESGSLGQQSPRLVSPDAAARACELLGQSILEFASTPTQSSEMLVVANRLLTQLDGSSATTPSVVNSPVARGAPRKLHAVAKIVQLSSPVQQSGWTDWPPPASTQSATIVRSGTRHAKCDDEMTSAPAMSAAANLQALPHGVTAPLRPITPRDPAPAAYPVIAASRQTGRVIQVSARADDVPLHTLSDVALVRQLANPDNDLTERVRVELVDRGFSSQQLDKAANLIAANPQERMRLADSLARSGQLGSEPWLSVVLSDPDRRVRLQAALALETTQDADVLAKLREQLSRETDPHVAARIRRILQLF